MKRCYYELLEVDKKATAAEIKTNYRKLALKYHPDKNPTEEARDMFLLITEAYEVLSDVNERTWYDNNREKILFNKDDMSKEDLEEYSFGFNIWAYFTSACFKGYDDSEGAFYQVYREVIEKIKTEEAKAFVNREEKDEEEPRKYEGFGDSNTIQKKVLQFYDDWENFTTYKSFVWVDEWDTRDAQNRYIKREMEKENKKERIKEKKNYIKTIKDLISFLKKRDPRYREYLMEEAKKEEEKERLKKEKEEEKKKEKEEMKKIKQQIEEDRFREIEEYHRKQQGITENNNKHHEPSSEEYEAEFYCQICSKEFKSQNQLLNHENSKMHKQNVKILQKEVMSKEEMIKEVEVTQEIEEPKKSKKNKKKKNNKKDDIEDEEEVVQETIKNDVKQKIEEPVEKPKEVKKDEKKNQKKKNQKNQSESEEEEVKKPAPKKEESKRKKSESDSDDDTDAFMNLVNNKNKKPIVEEEQKPSKKQKPGKNVNIDESSEESEEEKDQKKGMAKLKKEKKAAQEKDTGNKCNICSASFASKTKLFEHINKTGHAKAK